MFEVIQGGYMKTEKRPRKFRLITHDYEGEITVITIRFKDLDNSHLTSALEQLSRSPVRSQTAYKLSKVKKAINDEIKEGRELYKKLLAKHCEQDEKGEPLYDETTKMAKFKEGAQELFAKEMEEFLNTPIELAITKIPFNELADIKINADQIAATEFIFEM